MTATDLQVMSLKPTGVFIIFICLKKFKNSFNGEILYKLIVHKFVNTW